MEKCRVSGKSPEQLEAMIQLLRMLHDRECNCRATQELRMYYRKLIFEYEEEYKRQTGRDM